jgi:hypothetical protein
MSFYKQKTWKEEQCREIVNFDSSNTISFQLKPGKMASSSTARDESSNIEGLRDEALLYVDQALVLEETNRITEV